MLIRIRSVVRPPEARVPRGVRPLTGRASANRAQSARVAPAMRAMRRSVAAAALAWLAGAGLAQAAAGGPAAQAYDLLVGTYTGGASKGIQVLRFDTATGELTPLSSVPAENPSYLAVSADGRYVYAVAELPGEGGGKRMHGAISAYAFDARSGTLTLLNRVSSEGNDPCYLKLSPDGKYLAVANYSVAADPGGSVTMLPLRADGSLGTARLNLRLAGSGPVRGRQDGSHVHSTVFAPDGRYLFVQDLGADRLDIYRYAPRPDGALLRPAAPDAVHVHPGAGPRHLVFSADGRFAYLVTELDAAVSVYAYRDGALRWIETLPMVAAGFSGKVGGAAVHLSPDGRFLYASNRGDANEIVFYAVHADDGRLTLAGRQSTQGRAPREFVIDPSGRWLIAGNQDSDSIVVFQRDPETGRLTPRPVSVRVGQPVDFKLVPVPPR